MLLLVVDLVLVKGLLKFKEPELNLLQKLRRLRRKLLELLEGPDKHREERLQRDEIREVFPLDKLCDLYRKIE